MKMYKVVLWGSIAAMLSSYSHAGAMCDSRYENNVIQNQGCELGSANNDSTAQVNLDSMFGNDDWTQVWKSDSGDAQPTALTDFTFTADMLSGSFTLNWGIPPTGDVMFVLKDGQDDPWQYVGWLLDPATYGAQNYAFNTPFLNTTGCTDDLVISPEFCGELKQISHAAFYYRNGGPTTQCVNCGSVSAAATLPLFGIGALGLLWNRRRKV